MSWKVAREITINSHEQAGEYLWYSISKMEWRKVYRMGTRSGRKLDGKQDSDEAGPANKDCREINCVYIRDKKETLLIFLTHAETVYSTPSWPPK